jgi:hypothetical protein
MFMRLNLLLFTAMLASSLGLNFAAAQGTTTFPTFPVVRPEYSAFGHITALETGRTESVFRDPENTMSVSLDVAFVNPGPGELGGVGVFTPCKIADAGYALDPKDPAVTVHEAALLSAFLAGKKVRVVVNGCIFDKPRIIGVDIGEPLH